MAGASDCRGGSAGGGGQEASQGFPEGNRELDSESAGLLGLHVEDGQAGGRRLDGHRQETKRPRPEEQQQGKKTDDMMVMEPDDQLQVKVRTCLGGHPGPEHLGMTWWQA